jgi:Gas vesicle synthesis protein GvpL/GvpF
VSAPQDRLRRLAAELADALAPEVLDRAVQEAARRVGEELVEELTEALRPAVAELSPRHPRRPLGAPGQRPGTPHRRAGADEPDGLAGAAPEVSPPVAAPAGHPATGPRTSGTAPERCLYVYAITRPGSVHLTDVDGLEEAASPELVESGDLALVVSELAPGVLADVTEGDVSEDSDLVRLARRHDAVVRAVAAQAPVLPLRFGTAVADRAAVERLLDQLRPQARAGLDRVAGQREWGVRICRTEAGADPPAPPTGEVSGADYMRRRSRELQDADRRRTSSRAATEDVRTRLSRHATESLPHLVAREGVVLEVVYLVPLDAEAAFTAEAERLTAELARIGLALETTGPWPPYSFTGLAEAVTT